MSTEQLANTSTSIDETATNIVAMSSAKVLREKARNTLGNNVFKRAWLWPVLLALIAGAITSAVAPLSIVACAILAIAFSTYFVSLVRGTNDAKDFSVYFLSFENNIGSNIVTGVLYTLYVTLWNMVPVVGPVISIIKSLSYGMVFYIKADHPEYSAAEALEKSKKMMRGYEWKYFCLQLSFIGWDVLTVLSCCVLANWVTPYKETAKAHFYEELKALTADEIKNADEHEKVINPAVVKSITSKKAIAPCAIAFASICLMGIGCLLMWIFNIVLPQMGFFSIADGMTKSTFGTLLVSVIHSIVPVLGIVAAISMIKIICGKNVGLANNIRNINLLNKGMHMFAMFSLVDMGVIFFVSILKHNHYIISRTLNFMGYEGVGYKKTDDKGGVVISIIYAVLCLVVPVVLTICYNAIKEYFKKLENSANGAQFDKGNKAPFGFAIIAACLNFVLAVVAMISGVYVDGVIFLACSAYMIANALYVIFVNKDLLKTSFD